MSTIAQQAPPGEAVVVTELVDYTATSLVVRPEGVTYDEYEQLMGTFGAMARSCAWWIGDAINYGERAYGEKYAQALEATRMAPQTLINYAHTCRTVPPHVRREELPFSHHEVVNMLPVEEQAQWLQAAIDNHWSRSTFRETVAQHRAGLGHVPRAQLQATQGHADAVAAVEAARAAQVGGAPVVPAPAPQAPPVAPPPAAPVQPAHHTVVEAAAAVWQGAIDLDQAVLQRDVVDSTVQYMAVPLAALRDLGRIIGEVE